MFKNELEKIHEKIILFGNDNEEVLKFFRSNGVMTVRDVSLILGLGEERMKNIIGCLAGKDNNKFLRKVPSNNTHDIYEITLEGRKYLRDLEIHELNKKQAWFNLIISITSIILAGCAMVALILQILKR